MIKLMQINRLLSPCFPRCKFEMSIEREARDDRKARRKRLEMIGEWEGRGGNHRLGF
jgi:hypothetical protein